MKRILAIILCACFALSAASCGCNSEKNKDGETGKAVISQVNEKEAKDIKPAKAVKHGNVSGDAAPEGWMIKNGEGGDFITYIKCADPKKTNPDDCPYVQIGSDILSPEDLLKSVTTLKDTKGENYTTDSVTIGENLFLGVFVEGGVNSLFGTVNKNTMVINYKDVEISDPVVSKIISGIEISS